MNIILHSIEAPNIVHTNTLAENLADYRDYLRVRDLQLRPKDSKEALYVRDTCRTYMPRLMTGVASSTVTFNPSRTGALRWADTSLFFRPKNRVSPQRGNAVKDFCSRIRENSGFRRLTIPKSHDFGYKKSPSEKQHRDISKNW